MNKNYEQQRALETRQIMELGRIRNDIAREESSANPNPDYFHSLQKRRDVLERELSLGRYARY